VKSFSNFGLQIETFGLFKLANTKIVCLHSKYFEGLIHIWGTPVDFKSEKKNAKLRKSHFSFSFQFKYSEILTLFPPWRTKLNEQLLKILKIFASDLNFVGLPHFYNSVTYCVSWKILSVLFITKQLCKISMQIVLCLHDTVEKFLSEPMGTKINSNQEFSMQIDFGFLLYEYINRCILNSVPSNWRNLKLRCQIFTRVQWCPTFFSNGQKFFRII